MSEFIPFCRPSLGDAEIAAVVETLRSGWITTGPRAAAGTPVLSIIAFVRSAVARNAAT